MLGFIVGGRRERERRAMEGDGQNHAENLLADSDGGKTVAKMREGALPVSIRGACRTSREVGMTDWLNSREGGSNGGIYQASCSSPLLFAI